MGVNNLTDYEYQDEEPYQNGWIDKKGPFPVLYHPDNPGKKGGYGRAYRNKPRHRQVKIAKKCGAAPLSRSHKKIEYSEKHYKSDD